MGGIYYIPSHRRTEMELNVRYSEGGNWQEYHVIKDGVDLLEINGR